MHYQILICDDDPDILDVIELTLSSEGFSCITTHDGEQAWEKIKNNRIDAVIIDYIMPKMNGIDLCKRIKADPLLSSMPVLMLTGKAETEDKIHGLEAGADDYIAKPFDPNELLARLKSILKRTKVILDTNPLTHLPGNNTIHEEFKSAIEKGDLFSIGYLDIDNFKAYNDKYGFEAGDLLIKETARILLDEGKKIDPNIFVGHIGGDDFVFISNPEYIEDIAKAVINAFDEAIPLFYDEDARKKEKISMPDRQGNIQDFPLATISIAITSNEYTKFSHIAEISERAAALKKKAKTLKGSNYLKDQRKTER